MKNLFNDSFLVQTIHFLTHSVNIGALDSDWSTAAVFIGLFYAIHNTHALPKTCGETRECVVWKLVYSAGINFLFNNVIICKLWIIQKWN